MSWGLKNQRMNKFHEPVLLNESVSGLNINPSGVYVDATFGGGGHSKQILNKLKSGRLIAFEQDRVALKNDIKDERFIVINKNFRYLKKELALMGVSAIDGLIADLGVSAYHFTDNNRGFSLKYDARIDMRMNDQLEKDGVFVLNMYSRKNLSRIFRDHADFKNPKSIVDAIINSRSKGTINSTFQLKSICLKLSPINNNNKFFARIFQAIRIEVNDEIGALKELLKQCLDILNPSGRIVVISYHSIEDRIVKSFMKFGNFLNSPAKDFFGNELKSFQLINKKPIVPSAAEIRFNSKSRSAKLRVCEKI